jgi:hypothetical protein
MTTDITVQSQPIASMRIQDLAAQVLLIQQCMKAVMRDKEHFGKIPGCGDKPALFKAGAEKLCLLFRMDPDFLIEVIELGRAHRECRVKAVLYSIESGKRLGAGVGTCSTMESKYRYRGVIDGVSTGRSVPKKYWDCKRDNDKEGMISALGGKGFFPKKVEEGLWEIFEKGETDQKAENPDPADQYNTVLKMAKKRALVDAVLTVTAASDIFTQDIEDMRGVIDAEFSELDSKGTDQRLQFLQSLQVELKAKELKPSDWPQKPESVKTWKDFSLDQLIALKEWSDQQPANF